MTDTTKAAQTAARCDERVVSTGGWHSHNCGRPVHEDGKCKIHCASAVAARRAKSDAAWKAKQAASPYAQIDRLRADNARLSALCRELAGALAPFANYACDPPNDCHNCRARAALAKAREQGAQP